MFEIARGSYTITTLASFNATNGSGLTGAVALDSSGNLFGATSGGGPNGDGTIFEIAKGSNAITTLASFNGSNGQSPREVTLDSSGNLYGTTGGGGVIGYGTVFEIASGSNVITTLASFNGTNGSYPGAGITLDAAGNLFGTTQTGGANNDGTVFEIPNGSTAITTLASFAGSNGYGPVGGITLDAAHNLYGATNQGGVQNFGTLFEIAAGGSVITTLVSFSGANGKDPLTGVTLDASGNLYGMAKVGGIINEGTVFELIANSAVTLTETGGPNPSTPNQPLTFTATVSGGVPDGETVTLGDASNNNTVLATGTLAGGSATLTVSAGTLAVGTHNLIAVYGGDANFAASESAAYSQIVQAAPPTLVGAPVINGDNPNGLYDVPGQPAPGVQRSMVEDIVYTFSEPVTIPDANAAFSVAVAGSLGTLPPTLLAQAVPGSNGVQWAVSLTGQPVGTLASIANGEYSITINPSAVFAAADGTTSMPPGTGRTDTFYRLYGDINGDRIVNNADNLQLRRAQATYNPALDYNADGIVNNSDNFQFRKDQAINFFSDGFVTSI